MTSESNLLNRIIITIEANNQQEAKKIFHGSLLNQVNIYNLFDLYFNEYTINRNIYLETLSLNLGEIGFHDFNSVFPVRLNAALNRVLSKYQENNNKDKTLTKELTLQKNIEKPSLLHDNYLVSIEDFIHYLYRKDFQLNIMGVIESNNTDAKKLINQLMKVESNFVLFLAKSCLSEHGLQRLLSINQPALLTAINRKLSEDIDIFQYQGEKVYSWQLVLNALGYIQRHDTQEIPKPDVKVISYITAELESSMLDVVSIITLFRQNIATKNSLLNEWLKPFWQIELISQLCKKHLSVREYENLVNRFGCENQSVREPVLQKITSVDPLLTALLQALETEPQKNLPPLNQHQCSLIATAIKKGQVKAQNILQLFQHPALYNRIGTAWLTSLWQLDPVSQICQKYLSIEEYQDLSQRFILNNADKKLITEDRQALSTLDNLSITGNRCNQPRIINKSHVDRVLLTEQTFPCQVSNAGILVLWPMLPALFNRLGLLEAQKFIHRQAQFNAVGLLDYLSWGNEEAQTERKILNNVLCGLMAEEVIELAPVEPEKKLIIEQWLDAIISQLPTWKKLSRNDARQLFLQRPGELLIDDQEIKIKVQHQPFDLLLTNWPWPLNIAKFPWLNRSLQIDWQKI
ncbi:contractile injection system tape measure protein [Photorhabdus sp. SF281]|uniref:contractile injection system tape measure protein n=1 Tax=Photorhabdus sp. SF281 TaxID=3459527 RepID=UPI004045172B